MPLENLLTLVETLRARVDDHGDALRQNEMLTRTHSHLRESLF